MKKKQNKQQWWCTIVFQLYIANASKFTINDDILTLLSYTDKNYTEQHNPNSLFERFLYQ